MKTITKFLFLLVWAGLIVTFAPSIHAQSLSKRDVKKIKKELQSKAVKTARKEAKRLKKQGFYIPPGALPMDKQLEKAYIRQYEMTDDGWEKYITGNAMSIGGTKIASKNQAIEAAKLELAGKLETRIAGLIENSIANEQITQEEAVSLTKTVTASKNIISQKLGRIAVLFEAYRDHGENTESTIMIATSYDLALNAAKETLRQELRDDAEELHKKLDKIFDLELDPQEGGLGT